MSSHPIVHIEISASDRQVSARFYNELFGWSLTDYPDMNYTMCSTGQEYGVGLNPVAPDFPPGSITFYVHADDVTEMLEKARGLGAAILVAESEIPGVGRYGFFKDPGGNTVGLMKFYPPPQA